MPDIPSASCQASAQAKHGPKVSCIRLSGKKIIHYVKTNTMQDTKEAVSIHVCGRMKDYAEICYSYTSKLQVSGQNFIYNKISTPNEIYG